VQNPTWLLRAGRTTLPYCMSWGTTERTMSMGMANPTPAEVPVFVKMAVLTPITRPCHASHSLSVWNTPHQQLNLHCLTGSVKEQAQYSTQGQKRDSCRHIIGMLRTQDVPTMQSMVCVLIVQNRQSVQSFQLFIM